VKKDNATLARYINARRKKEEARRKEEVEARRKVMVVVPMSNEGQNFMDVRTWWNSPPRVIHGLSLLQLAHIFY
jgi:hypothetical protein